MSSEHTRTDGTSVTYLTCAETAKLLRAALKAAFPGVKFSVRSSVYAGGASIQVTYENGPMYPAVDEVAQRYAGGSFDGMTDSMSYIDTLIAFEGEDLPRTVSPGADFVFVTRSITGTYREDLARVAQAQLNCAVEGGYLGPAEFTLDNRSGVYWCDVPTEFGVLPGPAAPDSFIAYLAHHVTPEQAASYTERTTVRRG
jgi:hypothetical protein